MKYYIQRGLNEYGPYTLADLQRYIASGNIQLSDLTRNESMTEWVPVSEVIGNIPLPAPAASAGAPYGSTPAAGTGTVYGGATPASATGAASGPSSPGSIPTYGNPAGSYTGASTPAGGTVYGSPGAPGGPAYPGALPAYETGAMRGALMPPDLHWALVLLIGFFCGLFSLVWMFMEASFVKKLRPQNSGMAFYIGAVVVYVLTVIVYFGVIISAVGTTGGREPELPVGALLFCLLLGVTAWALMIIGSFKLRDGLVEYYNTVEPINLRLSGVMTFFFALYYFQYHFSRIAAWKKTGYLAPQ
ncbi:MAG: GYF domain-containing protein [Acidobacteriia bacterium]|nr:GYF domain-containing protein [Terriglobia bacterium]